MAEYIERDRLATDILGLTIVDPAVAQYADAVLQRLKDTPAADVVEVVRCKDCTMFDTGKKSLGMYWDPPENDEGWCNFFDSEVNRDGFCSKGEMKEK